jgi:peptidoglycan/LPS O-acetylase OafA/YrhL
VGRKPTLLALLALAVAGCLLAAWSTDPATRMLVRALLGAGLVTGACAGLVADRLRAGRRARILSLLHLAGVLCLPVALFAGSMEAASGLAHQAAALLAMGAFLIAACLSSRPSGRCSDTEATRAGLARLAADREASVLPFTNLMAHWVMGGMLPHLAGGRGPDMLLLLLGALAAGCATLIYERKHMQSLLAGGGLLVLAAVATLALAGKGTDWPLALVLGCGFFVLAFCLPWISSSVAPPGSRGTMHAAMAMSGALGLACGALAAALARQAMPEAEAWSALPAALLLLALLFAIRMPTRRTKVFEIRPMTAIEADAMAARLRAVAGVREVLVLPGEGTAHVKIDRRQWDRDGLMAVLASAGACAVHENHEA